MRKPPPGAFSCPAYPLDYDPIEGEYLPAVLSSGRRTRPVEPASASRPRETFEMSLQPRRIFGGFFMAREITAATRALPRVEEKQAEIVSLKRLVARRFMRHRLAVFGLCVITFMISFAYIGPF